MKKIVFLAASCVLIAACSDSGTADADADADGEISVAEMQEEAAGGVITPQAGKYKATIEMVSIEMPGAPDGVVEMMKSQMNVRTSEHCLTQEEADEGFEKMAEAAQQGDCTVKKFDMNGGDFNSEMTCNAGNEGKMSIAIKGKGTPTSMDMTVSMEGDMPGMGAAKMVMRTTQERIGACS